MVLFRAVVMLSCLVLIPMAAIFGSAFPSLIQCCLPDSWRAVAKNSTEASSGAVPAFGPARSSLASNSEPAPQWPSTANRGVTANGQSTGNGPSMNASDAHSTSPGSASLAAAPTWPDAEGRTASVPIRRNNADGGAAVAGGYDRQGNVPAVFSAPAETATERSRAVNLAGATRAPVTAPLANNDMAAQSPAGANTAAAWPSASSGAAAEGTDRFSGIEQRLRSYGATHYHLETWGARGELYRFQCQMPAASSGAASPSFEAVDSNALEAMQRVVQQIETLRSTVRQ